MKAENTFGIQFFPRQKSRESFALYARITVNTTRTELSLKQKIRQQDWNKDKGMVKSSRPELRQLSAYLEQVRAKIVMHYRELLLAEEDVTAETVKDAFLGRDRNSKVYTVLWLCDEHQQLMKGVLKPGTLKNYNTTRAYLEAFIKSRYQKKDLPLKQVSYEFMTALEYYIKNYPIKQHDACTNNGTMKHMERFKKMLNWAIKNEWLKTSTATAFKLHFRKTEIAALTAAELKAMEQLEPGNPTLLSTKDVFIFSCYTGLSYADVITLRHQDIFAGEDGRKWLQTSREKTNTLVQLPLLAPAEKLYLKYSKHCFPDGTILPPLSNQEINRSLKILAEIAGIKKKLTFHIARHTFATTVTLMNGVPIESISKMLGHTKLSTTMIYARINQHKIGMDMARLETILKRKKG